MQRPRIYIRKDFSDYVLEVLGITLLILLIAYPVYYFGQLPEVIPRHFNAAGEADGFGSKNHI